MNPAAFEIAKAIEDAQVSAPGVRVIIKPHCNGRAWIADHCCSIVYLSGGLAAGQAVEAVHEALAVISAEIQWNLSADTAHLLMQAIPLPRGSIHEQGLAQSG